MIQYGFITFAPQPNDLDLLEEFKILINPLLTKAHSYLLSLEKGNTPGAHLHLILSYENKDSDRNKIKQKFITKNFKLFYEKLKHENRLTQIDSNFHEKALQIKSIPKNDDDYRATLGYVGKERVIDSKGYTEDFITTCVKYYHIKTRNEASKKPKNTWRVLNSKTFHVYTQDFCEKNDILPNSENLLYNMTQNGIEVNDLPVGKRNSFIASINLKQHHDAPFLTPEETRNYRSIIENGDCNAIIEENNYYRQQLNFYQKIITENNLSYMLSN